MAKVTRTPGPGRERLERAMRELSGVSGRVGWFESSKYPTGTSVAYVATIHEFGCAKKHIAPRMGLRAMISEKKSHWERIAKQGAKNILDGEASASDLMELLGADAEHQIRKQIASVTEPMLAESTLAARARRYGLEDVGDLSATGAKPLVDTGYMLATVTHVVENGNGSNKK